MEALQLENYRLRSELRVRQSTYEDLKKEKDRLIEENQITLEEMERLHQEIEVRKKMYQNLKESTDREIAELKRIKTDLEMRLQSTIELHDGGEPGLHDALNGGEERSLSKDLPRLSAKEIVESLSRWEGVEETTTLFKDAVETENESVHWVPGSPWNVKWKFVVNVYISAPPDTRAVVNTFLKDYFAPLVGRYREEGCSVVPCFMNRDNLPSVDNQELLKVAVNQVNQSDVFIGFLRGPTDGLMKAETEHGFLNNPSARSSFFLFLPEETARPSKLKDRVKKVKNNKTTHIDCAGGVENGLALLAAKLEKVLNEEHNLVIKMENEGDGVIERITYLEDMKREWEQMESLKTLTQLCPSTLVATDEVMEHLESYLNEDDPIASVLITSHPGMGKTAVITKWMEQLQQSGEFLVFYHFVKSQCSSSAESAVLYRRFLQKMVYFCKETVNIPIKPQELCDMFVAWLEKLSACLEESGMRAVFIIDNIDLLTNCEHYFSWILKPLPKNIRVVLTAKEDNFPDSWRALPSPSIPTPTSADLLELIDFLQEDEEVKLGEDHVGLLAFSAPESPLWCVLSLKYLLSLNGFSQDELDEEIETFKDMQDVPDLVRHMLEHLEQSLLSSPTLFNGLNQVLQLLYWSRNGMLLSEISEITELPTCALVFILHQLKERRIVSDIGGLYHIPHHQIEEGVCSKCCHDPSTDYLFLWTNCLASFFSTGSLCLISRCAEELPWLLKRAELVEELSQVVLNIDMLIHLYSSSYIDELLSYWSFITRNVREVVVQYEKALSSIEKAASLQNSTSLLYVISLNETIGKIFWTLSFSDEALNYLQHAYDLCESYLDPDGTEYAEVMCELARLHGVVGRHSTAEGLYTDALQIFELNFGEHSLQVLKVLEKLSTLYKQQGRNDMVDIMTARITLIKQTRTLTPSPSVILRSRVSELELSANDVKSTAQDKAKCLNELAVILAVYGDKGDAEENFMISLKLLESCFQENVTLYVSTLKNLGTFYIQCSRMELSLPLYQQAYEVVSNHYPAEHWQHTDIAEKLALVYRELGDVENAEPLQRQLLQLKMLEHGQNHLSVAKVLNNLAVICCLKGSFEEAVAIYDRAIDIYKHHLSDQHPTVEAALNNRKLALQYSMSQ